MNGETHKRLRKPPCPARFNDCLLPGRVGLAATFAALKPRSPARAATGIDIVAIGLHVGLAGKHDGSHIE